MKRSPDLQQPHDSTKKSKASETTISPFEETPDIEKLKDEGSCFEKNEGNRKTTSVIPEGNSTSPTECQGSQANSNKKVPTLQSNNDTPNIKISRRMEKIVATTLPRGSGFGSNNFAFFNGFAIPLQNVGPSLPTPRLGNVYRPQFGYQMNGNFSFPRPQSQQQQIQSTVAASIIRNSVRNNHHHVINPTATYSSCNTKTGATAFSFSQPWSTQALLNLNQTPGNANQNSPQYKIQNEDTNNRGANHGGCKEIHEIGDGEPTSSWKRIFQCCHCNSTNVREILIRSHNYCQNTDDGLRNMKATIPGWKLGQENVVENSNGGDSENQLNYKGGGVKRKRGYGIQDDYVLNGKFVDAEGNQSTDNEHENGGGENLPPLKKRFTFNSNFPQKKRDGNYYSFGDKLLPSGGTPVVNSFHLGNSNPSKVFNFQFGGNSSSSLATESSLASLRPIITEYNIECTPGCSKFENEKKSQKSQQSIKEPSKLSSHLQLVTNSTKNATNFSNNAFNNSPIRFQTFEQLKNSVSKDKEEMERKKQEKLSPLNISMSSVQLSSSTTSTKNVPSSSCRLSTSAFNVGIPNTQTSNSSVKNFPVGVLHGTSTSLPSIYNNNSLVHSPFSFGPRSNESLMTASNQQYESLVKPIMFLNGNPMNGFSSLRSNSNYLNVDQASTSTILPEPRFSPFLPPSTNPSVPNTFNFFGATRGQQNGGNTLFQFQGQVNSQVSRTGMIRKSPRRIKKGIRRLKRK